MKKTYRKSSTKQLFIIVGLISIYFISEIYSFVKSTLRTKEDTITELGQYSSVDANIELRYPKNWVLLKTPGGSRGDLETIAFASRIDYSFPWMNVAKRLIASNSDANSVESWGLTRINQIEAGIIFMGDTSIFTSDFFSWTTKNYSYDTYNKINPYIAKCKDYYLVLDSSQYVFSFCSEENDWDKYLQTFSEMILSVRPINIEK